ncbi:sensor domain-containing phosphodiesterase [Vibrio sp. HA2012]|uniref:EAL domain-containing protein n=1 Tax=Vibrio sp. HA2012 TaxID=1971595 RepID=UPI000C2C69E6|nr:EAL domain-containing protein [Vibrio sp. HA2012]PJC87904.1 sensor domain-containing phosphodiesterase [Vibrio sp. HA2012]
MSDVVQRRFMSMFDTAVEGLWIMTPDGDISFFNHSFYKQFNFNPEGAHLNDWVALIHPDDQPEFTDRVDDHLRSAYSDKKLISQYRVLKKDGSYCWIEAFGSVKRDEQGEYMVGNHRDITSQKKLESSIRRLAFCDKASGLPNHDQLKIDLKNRRSEITLLHIHLKRIQSYINQYGELVMQEVIDRTIQCLDIFKPYISKFYRNSTETFSVVLYTPITEQQLAGLCQNFIYMFSRHADQNGALYIDSVCIGAYPCHDLKLSPNEVINWAAQTSEYAYRNESCQWAICNDAIKKKVERYFYIESKLKSAISNDEISVRLQPIVCAKTRQLLSFEALARWDKSRIGEIYPDEFIPVAERKGLISQLGEKVLAQASSFIAYYNKIWDTDVKVNVNVSVLQLLDGTFPDKALDIVRDEGATPDNVVLELTESVLLEDKFQAMNQLRQLQSFGFRLAMDDFGSGHSSVTGFFKLPFQQLKIDKELVNDSMREAEPFAYLEFLTMLCSIRGIGVTIEGIETEEMMERFIQMDVSSFQGYLIAKPLTLESAMEYRGHQYYDAVQTIEQLAIPNIA